MIRLISHPDAGCNKGNEQEHLREFKRKHGQNAGNERRMRQYLAPRREHRGCAPHDHDKNSVSRCKCPQCPMDASVIRGNEQGLHCEKSDPAPSLPRHEREEILKGWVS